MNSTPTLPFRIRIGVASPEALANGPALRDQLRAVIQHGIPALLDAESQRLIPEAKHTRAVLDVVASLSAHTAKLVEEVICEVHPDLDRWRTHEERAALEARELQRRLISEPHRCIVDSSDVILVFADGGESQDERVAAVRDYAILNRRPVITFTPGREPHTDARHGLSARAIAGIEMFNKATARMPKDGKVTDDSDSIDVDEIDDAPIVAEVRDLIAAKIEPYYQLAKRMADRNKRWYRRAGLCAYCLSPLAVAAVAYAIIGHNPWGFGAEFILLAVILAVVVGTDRARARRKWIECRFLAERLRAARFLTLFGVEPSPLSVPAYSGMAHEPTHWMHRAFQEIWNQMPPLRLADERTRRHLIAHVQQVWIDQQIRYHSANVAAADRAANWLERGGIAVFALAMAAALAHLTRWFLGRWTLPHVADDLLTGVAIILPAVGASLGGLRSHREYSRLARRSKGMEARLRDLRGRLGGNMTPQTLEQLLRDAEQYLLSETQDWLDLMGEVRLRVEV